MTDGHDRDYESGLDREISLKGIVYTGAVLAIVVVLSAVLMWWLSVALRSSLTAADPPPPVLPEARVQGLPPEPRLQTSPEEDLRILRRQEDEILNGYGWIDQDAGVARVPIERAMEMMAEGIVTSATAEEVR